MSDAKVDSLRQALSVSPDNVPLLELFAEACVNAGLEAEARQAFDKILGLDAENDTAKLGIARILFDQGKYSEACIRAEALINDQPDHGAAWRLLAWIHVEEENIGSAKTAYERAIRCDGSLTDADLETRLYMKPRGDGADSDRDDVGSSKKQRQSVHGDFSGDEPEVAKLDGNIGQMEKPTIAFADVGGMDEVKEEIRMKIIYPMENPDLFRAYGKRIGGGVLVYGPPGCGKTLLSRATAGEIKARFISVGIHEILDLWLGNSEKNMHGLFEMARKEAPTILFFDEVDALAADRKHLRQSSGRTLINQFLAEMDGAAGENDGVLVIGATNAPWHIDPAFRRPGRFDRILFVPPPDQTARAAIIDILAKGKPIKDLDAKKLAAKTDNFSGADLKSMFDITIERSLAAAMKENRIVPITTKALLGTVKSIKPTTRSWFETAKNYALYSNQNGMYDDILDYLGIKK